MNQRIRCPNPVCPQPEDVQKVSIVVESGTRQQLVTPYYSVTSMSALVEQLAPPKRPENRGRWGVLASVGFFFSLFAFLLSLVVIVLILTGMTTRDIGTGLIELPFWGVVGTSIFIYKRTKAATFKREYPKWLRAQAKWDQLYYCNRCGSVFNPTEGGRFVPASRTKELLE